MWNVTIDDHVLHLSGFWRKVSLPVEEIKDVVQHWHDDGFPPTVTIAFKGKTEAGKVVRFISSATADEIGELLPHVRMANTDTQG